MLPEKQLFKFSILYLFILFAAVVADRWMPGSEPLDHAFEVRGHFVQGKEASRRHMPIFQGSLTQPWTKWVEPLRGGEMASISGPRGLAGRTTTGGDRANPISSPFRRLERVIKRF